MPNRLSRETSPYLLQHQNNPVDWYAWGEEALARARAEDKPILLSVGYFACHWCHVMEHESFENEAIAKLMNENYVCIKVDREEHPDLDQIYQSVAQAMTRSGGWPLTVFLTPELKPFFGGTYFPPDDRYGRPGFPRVLVALANAYRNERASVSDNAERLTDFIRQAEESRGRAPEGAVTTQGRALFDEAATRLLDAIDWSEGGFSGAPKFPNVPVFSFLWRYGIAAQSARAREAVLLTLDKEARGGIFDQLGGGFHRYSVDDRWAVPHFEKMLYDNGLLLRLYAEALLSGEDLGAPSRRELFTDTISMTVSYLLSEMRSPDGLFYAAQDADSEGEEGKYFAWNLSELSQVLESDEAAALALRYGVTADGNFEHGKTVLFQARSVEETAAELGVSAAEALIRLNRAKEKLSHARAARVAPGTDTKALGSWNGLAISGLAWAAQALAQARPAEAEAARKAVKETFTALKDKLARPGGLLYATFQIDPSHGRGVAKHSARLDDYAFLASAALDAARFVAETPEEFAGFLDAADEWVSLIVKAFAVSEGGGYFLTSDEAEVVLQRPRSLSDQATPSGTAIALEAMAALAALDWKGAALRYESELSRQLAALSPVAARNPYASSELLSFALLCELGPITISGGSAAREACRHTHVYRGLMGGPVILCHRQTCLPPTPPKETWAEARARTQFEVNDESP